MAKDGGPSPIESSRDGARRGPYVVSRRKGADEDKSGDDSSQEKSAGSFAPERREEAINVTIAGLPADRLTPETERVIEHLLADLGRLRGELDAARRRLAQLEQILDRHPFLPILSREAFRRQIVHVLERADRLPSAPSLFLVSLLNGDNIRREFGIKARDQALDHLCAALRSILRPDDILGSLTGNDLAVLVFVDVDAVLHVHHGALVQALAERPFSVGPQKLELTVASGIAPVMPGMGLESLIAAADADLTSKIRG